MASSITITSKPGAELTADEIADCYELAIQGGVPLKAGMIESVHLAYNPTVVLAHQNGRLVSFQTHSFYQVQTPFRTKKMGLIYGGLAFQNRKLASQGIAHRMVIHYMRKTLGPFWMWRDYAVMVATVNPRIIQLMAIQYHLYLPGDDMLTPSLIEFIRGFARQERSNSHPISDQLVMSPSTAIMNIKNEITHVWSHLYRASNDRYNQLVYRLKIVENVDDRYYLLGRALLVVGRSSRSRLVKSGWLFLHKQIRMLLK